MPVRSGRRGDGGWLAQIIVTASASLLLPEPEAVRVFVFSAPCTATAVRLTPGVGWHATQISFPIDPDGLRGRLGGCCDPKGTGREPELRS